MTSSRTIPDEIHIIGAGIAGLALARILKHRGHPFRIFERRGEQAGYRYGVTIHPEAYTPFLRAAGIEEKVFRKAVVQRPYTLSGQSESSDGQPKVPSTQGTPIRARRDLLEDFLLPSDLISRESLKSFEPIEVDGRSGLRLHLTPSSKEKSQPEPTEVTSFFTVSAEGEHSELRKAFAPNAKLDVLPYAAYHGRRTVSPATFRELYASHFDDASNTISMHRDQARLQVEYIRPKEDEEEGANNNNNDDWTIRYTYSRPAHAANDPLYTPARAKDAAKTIPQPLISELDNLAPLPSPFAHAFDSGKIKAEHDAQQTGGSPRTSVLNWLMRTVSVSARDAEELARRNVVVVGNAAHAEPIVGGFGASAALLDAVELVEAIERFGVGREGVEAFYGGARGRWAEGVEESVRCIERMHHGERGSEQGRWEAAPSGVRYEGYKVLERSDAKM